MFICHRIAVTILRVENTGRAHIRRETSSRFPTADLSKIARLGRVPQRLTSVFSWCQYALGVTKRGLLSTPLHGFASVILRGSQARSATRPRTPSIDQTQVLEEMLSSRLRLARLFSDDKLTKTFVTSAEPQVLSTGLSTHSEPDWSAVTVGRICYCQRSHDDRPRSGLFEDSGGASKCAPRGLHIIN